MIFKLVHYALTMLTLIITIRLIINAPEYKHHFYTALKLQEHLTYKPVDVSESTDIQASSWSMLTLCISEC